MLIGDIWLRKRQASSHHLLESGNLKFHPVVRAQQARPGDRKSYTGQGEGASPPLSITVLKPPARCGVIQSSPSWPSRDKTPPKMAAMSRSGADLVSRSLLSCFWGTGCFYVEWLTLAPKGLGCTALGVYVCGHAADRHASARRLHTRMGRVHRPPRPTSPHTSHLHPCK